MVYRGKPSAGCENCRKAKKRCGLEQPACSRCVKLKKICSGYRDTTALQIQDETSAVKRKAERQKAKTQPPSQTQSPHQLHSNYLKPPTITENVAGIPTPGSINSDSTSSSDSTIDIDMMDDDANALGPYQTSYGSYGGMGTSLANLTFAMKPKPDDVATNYFIKQFTSNSHWEFMQAFASQSTIDPCLSLALKACGMAALDNVQHLVMGKDYARSLYVEALGLLNESLRDPKRSKTDESLIAVSMLGYFENLTCDGRQSIQSWKAHISGATQLLKLRGKAQFKTQIGRLLFRETRAQILIHCIWDDLPPPDFLWEFQEELAMQTDDSWIAKPADAVASLCFDFAVLRSQLCKQQISDQAGAEKASDLERRFIQWQIDTVEHDERWRYYEIEVDDSRHVWDGRVHAYAGHPAPHAWNTYRSMRIMLTRTQEMLCRKFQFSEGDQDEQMQYFRKTRRQLTDEICATIPACLGHASPAFNSPCVLITAYASIWPLFFAGTCTLERVGSGAWSILMGQRVPSGDATSSAAAQAMWIMGRLDYISQSVGLKWADGVAATLRGDFRVLDDRLDEDVNITEHVERLFSVTPRSDQDKLEMARQKTPVDRAPWLKKIEEARRGPRYLIEKPSPLSDALAEESAKIRDPIWLGRAVGLDSQVLNPPDQPLRGFGI